MHIHWFRRDLRLTDNTALHYALEHTTAVIPVYILSDWSKSHPWTGAGRQEFLCGSLKSLSKNLETIGGRLIIRHGDPVEELRKLIRETKARIVFANRDPDPYGRKMEGQVEKMAQEEGCRLQLYKDVAIHERDEVRTATDTVFRVFTPYSKAWRKLEKPALLPMVNKMETPDSVSSLPLPSLETWSLISKMEIIEPGEPAARKRMQHFFEGKIWAYAAQRNFPAAEGASRLSQDLRWGLLSPRELYLKAAEASEIGNVQERKSADIYINELIWREFYLQILWHYPEVLEADFNPKFAGVKWMDDGPSFQKWCNGETGFPIIDAAMRQLNHTGYMHNRLRMISAMFLTKDLHIHWKQGEQYFMQKLTDGDIASNNGGWQWSAGTGADAAPYFRIQNPWTQTKRFDQNAVFIKTWLPELREVPIARLQDAPTEGEIINRNYPPPMVDHSVERDITLRLFKEAR